MQHLAVSPPKLQFPTTEKKVKNNLMTDSNKLYVVPKRRQHWVEFAQTKNNELQACRLGSTPVLVNLKTHFVSHLWDLTDRFLNKCTYKTDTNKCTKSSAKPVNLSLSIWFPLFSKLYSYPQNFATFFAVRLNASVSKYRNAHCNVAVVAADWNAPGLPLC